MECPICLNDWNSEQFTPYMFPCGHSFCRECVLLMVSNDSDEVSILCPTCSKEICLKKNHGMEGDQQWLSNLCKNYAVMSLIESKVKRQDSVIMYRVDKLSENDCCLDSDSSMDMCEDYFAS